ncbi:MAG TPA: TRIC cation channel family protein, partial [Arachnia sp.]|nr:TRIC cation channel family protein [Arachnia sp.]HMR13628.1 TRIC cation channel family protein [Arachnia sp.]
WERIWPPIDALAVGTWAAAGTLKTLGAGFGVLPALMLGTITAVGGGFTRDVVLRRVPAVLGGNTLYATAALVASGVAVVAHLFGFPVFGSVAATLVGAGLVLLARRRGLVLPAADDALNLGHAVRRGIAKSRRWLPRKGEPGSTA